MQGTSNIGTAIVEVGAPFLLLPGLYDVLPAPVGILTGTATAGVTPGGAATADLQPELSDTALETASAQVQAYIDACTAPTDAVPEGFYTVVELADQLHLSISSVRRKIYMMRKEGKVEVKRFRRQGPAKVYPVDHYKILE